jgi:hypothetical protein
VNKNIFGLGLTFYFTTLSSSHRLQSFPLVKNIFDTQPSMSSGKSFVFSAIGAMSASLMNIPNTK